MFVALAVSHWIERQTGWSIRQFVHTARRYRTVQIRAGQHHLSAADPLPADLRDALAQISGPEVRTKLNDLSQVRQPGVIASGSANLIGLS